MTFIIRHIICLDATLCNTAFFHRNADKKNDEQNTEVEVIYEIFFVVLEFL